MSIEEVAMKSSRRDFFAAVGAGSALVITSTGAVAAAVGAGPAGQGNTPMPRTGNPGTGTINIPLPLVNDLTSPEKDPLHGLAKRADVRSRQVGIDLALYDPATTNVYILNPMAALLWQHIASGRTLKSIHEMLWLAYSDGNLSPERLMGDLSGTVGDFQRLNLIVPKASAHDSPGGGETPASLQITERSLSRSACGYQPPQIQTATLGDLTRLAQLPAMFLDVWVLPNRNALAQ
jgi:hypothetical protein